VNDQFVYLLPAPLTVESCCVWVYKIGFITSPTQYIPYGSNSCYIHIRFVGTFMEIQNQQSASQSTKAAKPRTKLCVHDLQQELPHQFNFVKCEGLMVATLKMAIFWDVTPCSVANMFQRNLIRP